MKRKLFTFALLTTVVAGGAYATNSNFLAPGGPFYEKDSDTPIYCNGGAPLCSATFTGVYYSTPESVGQPDQNIQDLSLYTHVR